MARQPSFGPPVVVEPPPSVQSAPVIPSTALVASAVHYTGKLPRIYRPVSAWQRDCYRHYAICGEARYAAQFFGHALARATLHVEQTQAGVTKKLTEGPAVELLDSLFAGKDGQEQMLQAFGVHLTIAGECYLVGRTTDNDPDDPMVTLIGGEREVWEVVSVIEMRKNGDTYQIVHEGYAPIDIGEDDVVIRIWTPDPAERTKPDSPFKAALPVLREIEFATLHILSQFTSRLLGAGLMFVDQDLDFPPPVDSDGKPLAYANQAQGLMMILAQMMSAAMKDPGSAEAHVPIITTIPGATLQKGKPAELMKFWTDLDDKAREMRNDSIKRFALGLEMPPEQLLGMSSNPGTGGGNSNGVSHWGAWQIEESTIKMFVEPALQVVVNALTVGYLRPLLFNSATPETRILEKVGFNTANLRLRPDRSKEAQELNARGVLKDEVMVIENGFSKTDMMDEKEFRLWLLKKIASGSATPEQVAVAAGEFGIKLPTGMGGPAPAQQPRESRPDPSLEGHPTRREPEAASLLCAYESLALRALERAGNRIRAQHGGAKLPGIPAYAVHTKFAANGSSARVLEDAWSTAEVVLDGMGVDVEQTIERLNAYCLSLITSQKPHTREALAEFMEAS